MSTDPEPVLTGTVIQPSASSGRRRTLRQRLGRWLLFGDRHRASPTPPKIQYVPNAPSAVFTTPAMDDTYDFTVRIRWVWEAKDGSWDQNGLAVSVEDLKDDVWEKLTVATRCVLRSYPPHLPAEAENALNQKLTAIMRNAQIPDAGVHWTARAEVTPHEAVKTQLQKDWAKKRALDVERDLTEKIIEDRQALAEQWRTLLLKLGFGREDDNLTAPFVGRYLIRLAAQPQLAPDVVDHLSQHREDKDSELLGILQQAIQGRTDVNLLEADASFDSALRRLMDWAGLPLPAITGPPIPDDQPLRNAGGTQ